MQVEGLGLQAYGPGAVAPAADDDVQQGEAAAQPQQQPIEIEAEEQNDADDAGRGVIRLLQAGHFKGVADVRLRINFFDELEALEAEQLRPAAEQGAANVSAAVTQVIDGYAAGGDADPRTAAGVQAGIDALKAEFADAVQQATEDFTAAAGTTTGALTGGIENAFETLVAGVRELLGTGDEQPAATEEAPADEQATAAATEAVGEAAAVEGENPPIEGEPQVTAGEGELPVDQAETAGEDLTPLEAFLADLRAAFETAMQHLNDSLNGVSVLPELSEPTGNGRAYDKFLAIYNQMTSPDPDRAPDQQLTVDT